VTDIITEPEPEAEAADPAPDNADEYQQFLDIGYAALNRADALLIRRDLQRMAGSITSQIADAEASVTALESRLGPARDERDRLRSELDECIHRALEIRSATAHDDLTTRVTARSLRIAFEEESASLQARIDQADALVAGYQDEIGGIRHTIEQHRRELALTGAAIEEPFTHPYAQALPSYAARMFSCRTLPFLLFGMRDHPEYDSAVRMLYHLLRVTGIGAETERRVEEGVRAEYSDTYRMPDGSPVVVTGTATRDELARRFRAPVRIPSEAESANSSLFDQGQRTPGLPGSRPGEQP